MSDAKHTPGPWNVSPPTRQNPSEARVTACSGFVRIYEAALTAETEANARLISAAPDMLIAIREAYACLLECGDYPETEARLKATIAKAGG